MDTEAHVIAAISALDMRETAQRYLDLLGKYEQAFEEWADLSTTDEDAIRQAERRTEEYRARLLYVGQRLAELVLRHA